MAGEANNKHSEHQSFNHADLKELARDYLNFSEATTSELEAGEPGKITKEELKNLQEKYREKLEEVKLNSVYALKNFLKSTIDYRVLEEKLSQIESNPMLRKEEIKLLQRKFHMQEDGMYGPLMFANFVSSLDHFELTGYMNNHIRLIPSDRPLFEAVKIIPTKTHRVNRDALMDKIEQVGFNVLKDDVVSVSNDFTKLSVRRENREVLGINIGEEYHGLVKSLVELSKVDQEEAIKILKSHIENGGNYVYKINYVRQVLADYSPENLRSLFTKKKGEEFVLNFDGYAIFNKVISANHLFSDFDKITDGENVYINEEGKGFEMLGTQATLKVQNGDSFKPYINSNEELLNAKEIDFDSEFGDYINDVAFALKLSPSTLKSIMIVESNLNIHQKNRSGAHGIMQLTDDPFVDMALDKNNNGRGIHRYLNKFKEVFKNSGTLEKVGDPRAREAISDIISIEGRNQELFSEKINFLRRIVKDETFQSDPFLNIAIGSIYYSIETERFSNKNEKLVKNIIKKINLDDFNIDEFNTFLDGKYYQKITKEDFKIWVNELLQPENEVLREKFFALRKYNGDLNRNHDFNNMTYNNIYALKVLYVEQLEMA